MRPLQGGLTEALAHDPAAEPGPLKRKSASMALPAPARPCRRRPNPGAPEVGWLG